VQAEAHEPLGNASHLLALCHSVYQGGASGLRLANLQVMQATQGVLPRIGLLKQVPPYLAANASLLNEVYITPTLETALAVAATGVEMVALDATPRPRQDGLTLAQTVQRLKAAYPAVKVMGDCDSLASAQGAVAAGVDCISTTLAGYTAQTQATFNPYQPDWDVLQALLAELAHQLPVVAEGRFWHPEEAQRALALGASAVVVGSAITRPHLITQRFALATQAV